MGKNKYSNVGKKQIISVISQIIHKIEAIEMTLNMFIKFIIKEMKLDEETFNNFMKQELGGKDELQSDDKTDGGGDNSESNEDS